jgi:hypothetical protein
MARRTWIRSLFIQALLFSLLSAPSLAEEEDGPPDMDSLLDEDDADSGSDDIDAIIEPEKLDIENSTKLGEVFFGGDPWFIYCSHSKMEGSLAYNAFLSVVTEMKGKVNAGVLDCKEDLASGKTTIERFKLKKKKPVMFITANGNKPRQIMPAEYKIKEGESFSATETNNTNLVDIATKATEKKVQVIKDNTAAELHCFTKRKGCALLLHFRKFSEPEEAAIQEVIQAHRTVSFVSVHALRYKFSLQQKLPKLDKAQPQAGPRLVMFKPWMPSNNSKLRLPYVRQVDNAADLAEAEVGTDGTAKKAGDDEGDSEETEDEDKAYTMSRPNSTLNPKISLCAKELRRGEESKLTQVEADELFDSFEVSWEEFMTKPQVVSSKQALVELYGKRYPMAIGMQFAISRAVYDTPLLEEEVDELLDAMVEHEQNKTAKTMKKGTHAKAHTGAFAAGELDYFVKSFLGPDANQHLKMVRVV